MQNTNDTKGQSETTGLTNDNGLLLQDGHCLGYLFDFRDKGVFSPDGKVEITKEQADTHNRLLDQAMLNGLDENCAVGEAGTFYYVNGQVRTWLGTVVSSSIYRNGQSITFTRNGKTFRGRLMKDADCFNFRRVK